METTHQFLSLSYTVIRKSKKNISIKIDEKGKVIIYAPYHISYKYIEEVVKNKIPWILKNVHIVKERMQNVKLIDIQQGKKILWLGKLLNIKKYILDTQKYYIKIFKNNFVIYGSKTLLEDEENMRDIIFKFYREKAKLIFKYKVNVYSKKLNVYPKNITIRCQKTIWGSCYSNGNINFNCRLLMAPMRIIEYIVVHELCHLVYMNHSKDYWKLVEHEIPDYVSRRDWLKNNGYILVFPMNLKGGIYINKPYIHIVR
ncbi:M48 family metallopeptidase [Clostridium sp. BJN0013]|uniref:M48 family metallopeptidase n=1 Tax=Clostridium sp. BJN0013 TaxID=3236840 RepID=UPI0034C6B480